MELALRLDLCEIEYVFENFNLYLGLSVKELFYSLVVCVIK
jgi:hypothetical protein